MDWTNQDTEPSKPYQGPDFDEFCIRAGSYLPATRNRSECVTCPLGNLCQAGFEEQVRLVAAGENPSLTECKVFSADCLKSENLFGGLSSIQIDFVKQYVAGL